MKLPAIGGGRRRRLLLSLMANGSAQAFLLVAKILLIRYAFDHLLRQPTAAVAPTLAAVTVAFVAVAVGSGWLRLREEVDGERLGQEYVSRIRLRLFDRLRALNPRTLQSRSRGSLTLRFVGDLSALRIWVSRGIARGGVALLSVVGGLCTLAFLDWPLALAVAAVLGGGAVAHEVLGRGMPQAIREARRRRTHLAANVHEKIAAMSVVQVFGQSDRERKRLARQDRKLRSALFDRKSVSGRLLGVAEATGVLVVAAVVLVGAGEVAADRASYGTVVAAVLVGRLLMTPVRRLGTVHRYWHEALVARQKIEELLNTTGLISERRGATELVEGSGALELRNVRVRGSLKRTSVRAEAGSIVGIVGPNGSGKSTLLCLVARLIDPDKGRVLIDGHDIATATLTSVRRAVGMVSPDLPLLRGSVERNLLYRWPQAPESELRRVMELCGVDELVEHLPLGLRTRVADGGGNLSVGERRRISLARALLGSPRLLLLDEPEANLDSSAEDQLDRIVADYPGTVLWVTHDLDRLKNADAVWRLEDGRLEIGEPPRGQALGTGDRGVLRTAGLAG